MTDLTDAYDEFLSNVSGFKPLIPLSDADKLIVFKRGVRRMFIDTGRATLYSSSWIQYEGDLAVFPFDLGEDEIAYIILAACVAYYKQMRADMAAPNQITSHKTDALTVTFSDKSYSNIETALSSIEDDLLQLYHKMPQFVRGYGA